MGTGEWLGVVGVVLAALAIWQAWAYQRRQKRAEAKGSITITGDQSGGVNVTGNRNRVNGAQPPGSGGKG